ncbi:MAG: pilus assembly protein TadG-related protein [Pseudomonadota bacterium]
MMLPDHAKPTATRASGTAIGRFLRDRHGGASMLDLFAFLLFAGVAGLAVDVTNGYRHKSALQVAADAAAAAALAQLPDEKAARQAAIQVSALTMDPAIYGDVLDSADITIGTWDPVTRQVDTDAATPNAVQVTTKEPRTIGNPVSTFLLGVIGKGSWSNDATSTATRAGAVRSAHCPNAIMTRGTVRIAAGNDLKHTCIYGNRDGSFAEPEDAVSVQRHTADVAGTTAASMPDQRAQPKTSSKHIDLGRPHDGNDSAVKTPSHDPQIVDHLFCTRLVEEGRFQTSPDELHEVDLLADEDCSFGMPGSGLYGVLSKRSVPPAYSDALPPWDNGRNRITRWDGCSYTRYRRYVIDGDVTLTDCAEQGGWVQDVTILATGNIVVAEGVDLRNAMLFSRFGEIDLSAGNTSIGGAYCESGGLARDGNGEVYLMAHTVDLGSQIRFDGAVAVGQSTVRMGGSSRTGGASKGLWIEAGEQVHIGTGNSFGSCATPLPDQYAKPATAIIPGAVTAIAPSVPAR